MEANDSLLDLGAQLMAEHYPHLEIFKIEVIQGGGIKTIWKLETSIGTVCLKRIRKSIPIVKFTTAAQAYLASNNALVADIIPTKDDGLYCIHEGYALVLYNWIEGSDLRMDENWDDLSAGLKGLAEFQQASIGFIPDDDCAVYDRMGAWPDHYMKMYEELMKWKNQSDTLTSSFHQTYSSTSEQMIAIAKQAIQLLQDSAYSEWVHSIGKYGYLCHQDYGKGNALLTEQGVYILDLDNLAYDLPIRDVRKLISKYMDHLERWDGEVLERIISCYESILPLSPAQRRILYIDLLFPHKYYGYVKNPFKKGEAGELKKILEDYQFEIEKQAVLNQLLGR
ncbi:MAG: CotS family spore coat protein [Paenibacillaceae bacterium]